MHLSLLLAVVNPIDIIGNWLAGLINLINGVTHNYGWSMLALAVIVRVGLAPLYLKQIKSGREMQALQPYVKRLQAKHKGDPKKLQEEQMALFREHGVNPLGGCLPLLAMLPVMWGVYHAIALNNDHFKNAHWLWIGSPLSQRFPQWMAHDLFSSDKILLLAYVVSMYFYTLVTPTASADPQQKQMMKMQAIIMPVVLLFIGKSWSAAFVLYWFGFNILTLLQQWYVMRMPSRIPAPPPETPATLAGYPSACPQCKRPLTVAKGKCEACGAKVRKLAAVQSGAAINGAARAGATVSARNAGKKTGRGAQESR
ncbi:MAG: membrane protein insertase YidC [Candidatus Eremiobacteraeota bacterium]|nr:membrane protein insertase YidC [Candidatus Eremiobacteraeota bacterium]MBC5828288.1 membrane protein insertase YidC [Candidatus Eremiobacteraeota bacterium]